MEMKKIIAAVLALWMGLFPVPAYAGIGDAFDIFGGAVSSLFRKDAGKMADDIMQIMEKDPAQKKILREHIRKTADFDDKVMEDMRISMFLYKIPLVGGILSSACCSIVSTFYAYRASDDSYEIITKFEDLREEYWDAYGDLLEIVPDLDADSLLSAINAVEHANRYTNLEEAVKKIKEAAESEGTPDAFKRSNEKVGVPAAKDTEAEKYRALARQCGLDGEVAAMSQGTGDGSGICLIREAGRGDRYLIYNAADGMRAVVAGGTSVNQIKNNRDGQYAASFLLDIYNAPRSHDAAAGVWKGTMHRMPLLVKYEVKNGEVIPGMITTANGTESSAQCTEVLYETRNVTTINLLLTEMRSLR